MEQKDDAKQKTYLGIIVILLIFIVFINVFYLISKDDKVVTKEVPVVKEKVIVEEEVVYKEVEESGSEEVREEADEEEPVYMIDGGYGGISEEGGEITERELNKGNETEDPYTGPKTCSDDDGKNYFRKGTTTGYWIADSGPFDYPPTTKQDWCIGNTVSEMICDYNIGEIPRMQGVSYICPSGCRDGACICTSNVECGAGFECKAGICVGI